MHLHTYWFTSFLLLKGVLKNIITICRNFLWSGRVHTNRASLIAWEVVYTEKNEGVLSIADFIVWNEAAITKYVWNIANKADNLWVKWVYRVYLKGTYWRDYRTLKDCSWY